MVTVKIKNVNVSLTPELMEALIAALPVESVPAEPAVEEETDAAGTIWDAAVHTRTKSKNADGTWKKKRTAAPVEEPSVTSVAPVEEPSVTSVAELLHWASARGLTGADVSAALPGLEIDGFLQLDAEPELIGRVMEALS